MAFRVGTEAQGGRTIFTLLDDATGAFAAVLPSYGFNLFDLRLPLAGEPRRVIVASAGWEANPGHAGDNGIPIMFPFPNRIRGGRFRFGGKDYRTPANLGPNAIHGFAIDANWDVIEHAATDREAFIVGRYRISMQSPGALASWPTDAILQVRYGLAGRKLTLDATVSNPTAEPLPFGFGIHPYFRLPFPPGGDPAATRVVIPASEAWELRDLLPTGRRVPVDARLDFRQGRPMAGLKLDDVLTGLATEGGRFTCRMIDEAKRAELRMTAGDGFREVVVYTPRGDGDVIAIEPYTQTTDAINLQPRGVDAGLRVLGHGGHAAFSIALETIG